MSDQMSPGYPRPGRDHSLLVGWVFLLEGILKFVWPDELGGGCFSSIGIPLAHWTAPFVGVIEVVCGLLVIAGFLMRLAVAPLLIDISVAIISTKIPIWLGHGYWRFSLPKLKHYGLLSMLHESRADFSMLLGLCFLESTAHTVMRTLEQRGATCT